MMIRQANSKLMPIADAVDFGVSEPTETRGYMKGK